MEGHGNLVKLKNTLSSDNSISDFLSHLMEAFCFVNSPSLSNMISLINILLASFSLILTLSHLGHIS